MTSQTPRITGTVDFLKQNLQMWRETANTNPLSWIKKQSQQRSIIGYSFWNSRNKLKHSTSAAKLSRQLHNRSAEHATDN